MKRKSGYWTKDKCFEEFRKYKTKSEFVKNAPGAFTAMRRNGWKDEVWSELDNKIGNLMNRCVYIYEFIDNHVYIGLTFNIDKRNRYHMSNKSPVGRYMSKTNLNPKLIQLTDYINVVEASIIETSIIQKYKKLKWKLLNRSLGGETGGVLYWTKEKCIEIAKTCKTKNEFLKNYHGAWSSAKNNGWLFEIQEMFPTLIKSKGFWTKEKCVIEAIKYNKKEDFRIGSSSAYTLAVKNGWFVEITQHMKKIN